MYGHVHVVHVEFSPLVNISVEEFSKNIINIIVMSGTYAVDTFFTLSGFLVTRSIFNELDKHQKINITKMLFHRYIRITPAVAAVILWIGTIFKYFATGPVWNRASYLIYGPCIRNWWASLLYIQNFTNTLDMCLEESWYLAIDMQLFILAPFILYPVWKFKNRGYILLFSITFISVTYTLLYLNVKDLSIKYILGFVYFIFQISKMNKINIKFF